VARYARVFFPGRFQPVHRGHVSAIRWLLGVAEEVVVGVTAAQFNYTAENPFTAGERITMLKLALREHWDRLYVIPLDNVPDNSLWLSHVASRTPSFEAVATNNSFVELLARARGLSVVNPPLLERGELSGTRLRLLMAGGGEWKKLVPPAVAGYLEEIGGPERVRGILSGERVVIPRY